MPLPVAEAYSQVTGLKANNKLKEMWQKGIMASFHVHFVMEFWQTEQDKNLQLELPVRGPRFEKGSSPIRSTVLPTGWTSHSTSPCWHQLVSYRRNYCFLSSPQRGWELRQWEIPNGGLIASRDKPFPFNFNIIYSVLIFMIKYGVSLRQHSSIIDINLSHSYGKTSGQIITRQEMCVYVI